jgi:hypothetical protein
MVNEIRRLLTMSETNDRRFKILGAAWLGLGSLSFAFVFSQLFPLAQGNAPSATEVADGYWVFVVLGLVIGAIGTANGLALLRRIPVARRLLTISSFVLLPSAGLVVPLLVIAPSLWLTLSRDGKEAFEGYVSRENG